MNDITLTYYENLSRLGHIRRAREYHLYTEKGIRLVDFFQMNGKAILGHRPGRLTHNVKNTLEKGLYAEYPSSEQEKLKKALIRLFSDYGHCYCYRNRERAERTLSGKDFYLWRPWAAVPERIPEIQMLQIPIPGGFDCVPVLSRKPLPGLSEEFISPAAAAGALSLAGLWNIDREKKDALFWNRLPNPERFWKKDGPYMYFTGNAGQWQEVFNLFLDNKILLSPQFDIPSIIPQELTDFEADSFASLLGDLAL